MAAIPQQKPRLRNDEVEFQAEDELVTIVPKFESDVFALIGGRYGPFVPQTPVQVPLWLAVELRKQQKCQIQVRELLVELRIDFWKISRKSY